MPKSLNHVFLSNISKSMHILWTNIDNHSPYILNDLSIAFAHLQWWGIWFWLQNYKKLRFLWMFQGAASFLVTEGWYFKNLPNISPSEMFLSNTPKKYSHFMNNYIEQLPINHTWSFHWTCQKWSRSIFKVIKVKLRSFWGIICAENHIKLPVFVQYIKKYEYFMNNSALYNL